jgi:hypothetical protein
VLNTKLTQQIKEAENLNLSTYLPVLSPTPTMNGLIVLVSFFVAMAVLIGIYAIIRFRKHIRIIAAAALTMIIVGAVGAAVWYSQASIQYWLVSPYTTATQDNTLTIFCENTGVLAGTFDLQLSFTNAHFSQKTSLPYQLLNERTIKFTFTLQPGERQSRQAWFIIDNNVADFYVNLSFQQNDASFLVRSSPGGVETISYQKDTADKNFTMRTFAPPP